MTYDVVLVYYESPAALEHWLWRLRQRTDFDGGLTICDTGSRNIDRELRLAKTYGAAYVHCDTKEIRANGPAGADVRPVACCANQCLDRSNADVIFWSVLGSLHKPDFFSRCMALHEQQDALIQPTQYRIICKDFAARHWQKPFTELLSAGEIYATCGTPDWSCRRKHLVDMGGWNEEYVTWGMVDIEIFCRLTGCTDMGVPAHERWGRYIKTPYKNVGLPLLRPKPPDLYTLVCHDYGGHKPYGTPTRDKALYKSFEIFLCNWGNVNHDRQRQVACQVYHQELQKNQV